MSCFIGVIFHNDFVIFFLLPNTIQFLLPPKPNRIAHNARRSNCSIRRHEVSRGYCSLATVGRCREATAANGGEAGARWPKERSDFGQRVRALARSVCVMILEQTFWAARVRRLYQGHLSSVFRRALSFFLSFLIILYIQ